MSRLGAFSASLCKIAARGEVMDFRPGNTTLGFQASQSHKVTTVLFLSEKVFFSVALSKDPVAE